MAGALERGGTARVLLDSDLSHGLGGAKVAARQQGQLSLSHGERRVLRRGQRADVLVRRRMGCRAVANCLRYEASEQALVAERRAELGRVCGSGSKTAVCLQHPLRQHDARLSQPGVVVEQQQQIVFGTLAILTPGQSPDALGRFSCEARC